MTVNRIRCLGLISRFYSCYVQRGSSRVHRLGDHTYTGSTTAPSIMISLDQVPILYFLTPLQYFFESVTIYLRFFLLSFPCAYEQHIYLRNIIYSNPCYFILNYYNLPCS